VYGEAGSGKSTAAEIISACTARPIGSIMQGKSHYMPTAGPTDRILHLLE
jgi:ABC-type dipeptide/oligopeptide/nickel transport system ATPase subunit